MNTADLLSRFLTKGTGKHFYRVSNADGKTWLMPARNMRTAMNLYQPSGRNGKLVKTLFPLLHRIPFVRNVIHAEVLRCDLADELKQMLCRLFHEDNLEFAVFCGTPCVHQKITMQLSKGNRILGYCKTTNSDEISALFKNESELLRDLHRKGMMGIPESLFCGELKNGANLFVQTTVKTGKSKVLHRWTYLHENFLHALYYKTHQSIVFEDSDYYKTLIQLKRHVDWLPEEIDSLLVTNVTDRIFQQYKEQTVDFSAYHADFTPWNTFIESGNLFVFDWEYARLTYPPLLDRYHFFTQTAIFERRWAAEEIAACLRTPDCEWINREMYLLYLLDVIARFTIREKGNVNGDIARSMKIWGDLLKYLCQ